MDALRSRMGANAQASSSGMTSSCRLARPALAGHFRQQQQQKQQLQQRRPQQHQRRVNGVVCRAERKEYYDFKDMPPLPLGVKRIYIPELDYVVFDKSCEEQRLASLAIFFDIHGDDQYGSRLTRKSAITALCMYDRDDVDAAARRPGDYPNIDLLQRVYKDGLSLELVVEQFGAPGGN